MRTKRKQRWDAKRPKEEDATRPDPFSDLNDDLVETEEAYMETCPCCLDMRHQQALNKLEAEYLAWTGKTS